MRSKKNVLVSLSIFIAAVFILSLFSQQPEQGVLWETIKTLKGRVAELETSVSSLQSDMGNHTHDYADLTGFIPSHMHDILDIDGLIDADTLQGSDASAFSSAGHTHDYASLTEKPTILSDTDVIALINEHALLKQPDWDSGWVSIEPGNMVTIPANLGTKDILVNVLGKSSGGVFYHNAFIGGDRIITPDVSFYSGLTWYVYDNLIRVIRHDTDTSWAYFRLVIWKLD